jgi:transcriptional regulator with XRE-family HTH domain
MPTLDRLRERPGLSRGEAARGIGVPVPSLAGWEAGRHRPKDAELRRIAAFYGVEVAAIDGLKLERGKPPGRSSHPVRMARERAGPAASRAKASGHGFSPARDVHAPGARGRLFGRSMMRGADPHTPPHARRGQLPATPRSGGAGVSARVWSASPRARCSWCWRHARASRGGGGRARQPPCRPERRAYRVHWPTVSVTASTWPRTASTWPRTASGSTNVMCCASKRAGRPTNRPASAGLAGAVCCRHAHCTPGPLGEWRRDQRPRGWPY